MRDASRTDERENRPLASALLLLCRMQLPAQQTSRVRQRSAMTVVMRLRTAGVLRVGSTRSGFRYRYAHGGRPSVREIERIRQLKIPPAWRDVAIDPSPTARVQAVGQDRAGRWQYLYHQRVVERRERRKFERLLAFTRALPRLRGRAAQDLAQPGIGREKVLACILRILATCFLRPGSEEYASENGSYGLATLRPDHVRVSGERIRFEFNGKSGKEHTCELQDRAVARTLRELLSVPGRDVFKFRDQNGNLKDVRRHHINAYIKEVMGRSFSAKDFRTWAGTVICACTLARWGVEESDSPTRVRKKIVAAVKETAAILGNTPAVCRSSYISPSVIDAFHKGRVIARRLENVADLARHRKPRLHDCERALLRLLEAPEASAEPNRRRPALRRAA